MIYRSRPTLLHLQMGQDVLYVMLSFFVLTSVITTVLLIQAYRERSSAVALDQPPIITLKEADGYFFASGSAQIGGGFAERLRSVVGPQLAGLGKRYGAGIIEVVGHTDEQPLKLGLPRTTLDRRLLDFLHNRTVEEPRASDNVGLGMARAVAIVKVLRSDPNLAAFQILPFSAGQAVDVGDRLSVGTSFGTPVEERRRIEVRLRRAR
jgi:hypothetical protein